MTAPDLRSVLAGPLRRFLEHKRALNRKYRTEERDLRVFDRYLAEKGITSWEGIDSALIDRFLQWRNRPSARGHNLLLYVLRQFFAWAVAQRLTATNPVTARPRRVTSRRVPYLFDLNDMRSLLHAARQLPDNSRATRRALVYETAFALLYGLGLRAGEAARLRLGDVDRAQSVLLVRETKFGKSRFVPMGPNLARHLAAYVDTVHGTAANPEAPLFSFRPGRCIHPDTLSHTFRQLLPALDLRLPRGVATPRLHDLRHSFAVGTLLRWYRDGIDPQTRLIQLSTFLGHASPASTAVYLTITEDLLAEAHRRFHTFARPGDVS